MSIDRLIKDSLNNRTSSLDISPEKFEEMIDYIEVSADKASKNTNQGIITSFRDFISSISMRGWAAASLVILLLITLPVISKGVLGNLSKSSKSSTISKSSNDVSDGIGNPSVGNRNGLDYDYSGDKSGSPGMENSPKAQNPAYVTITLSPNFNSNAPNLSLIEKDLKSLVKYLYSHKIKKLYINDIVLKENSIISTSEDSKSLLIDNSSISLTETIKIKVLGNIKNLEKDLQLDFLENYKAEINPID